MRKLLVAGDGKKYFASVILNAIFCLGELVAGLYFFISAMEVRRNADLYRYLGVALVIMGMSTLFPLFLNFFKSKTYIKVFEDGIEGNMMAKGVLGYQNVKIPFEQIKNVDTFKNVSITIYTQHTVYTCSVSNGTEIRDVMERQQRKQ